MKQFEYKISALQGIFFLIFFSLFAFFGIAKTLTNTKGIVIARVIELSPNMATFFLGGTSLILIAMAFLGLLMIVKSFQKPNVVMLDSQQITAPTKPISNNIVTMKYSEIITCNVKKIGKTRQLIIKSKTDKIVMANVNFANKADFAEIVDTIAQKIAR